MRVAHFALGQRLKLKEVRDKMVTISGYQFEGGFPLETTKFNEIACVYAIYTNDIWLDIGETDKLRSRLIGHERKDCWKRNANGKIIYLAAFQESNQQKRISIEAYLRSTLNPTCGEQ